MNALIKRVALMVVGAAALSMPVSAQETQAPGQGKAYERIEQYKKIRLMEVLNLDEQTSIKFFARYNENLKLMRSLRQKQIQAFERIQELRKTNASDAEYDKIIGDLLSLENQMNDAKTKYVDELKEVLTSKQLAEYLVFELRFQQNLRELARDMQRERQGSPRR